MNTHWISSRMNKVIFFCGVGIVLGVLVFGTKAWAFNKSVLHNDYSIRNKKSRGRAVQKISRNVRERKREKFREEFGSEWDVTWNKETGVPHRVIRKGPGSSSQGLWRGFFWGQDELVDYAHSFIQDNAELFRLGNSEVQLVRVTKRGGVWYLDFQQKYQGIPICGSRIRFEFDESYRLLSFGADTYPEISLETVPSIDEAVAWGIVKHHLQIPSVENSDQSLESTAYKARLVIFPTRFEEGLQYSLAWLVEVGSWQYFVDAQEGDVLCRYNRSRQAISGQMKGMMLPRFFNSTPVQVPFQDQKIYIMNRDEPVLQEFMDGNNPNWDTEGLWGWGNPSPPDLVNLMTTPGHAGPPDPNSGYTGSNIYGYNLLGDYTNLMRPKYLTTHIIDCTGKEDMALRFYRWLGVYKEYNEDDYGVRENFDKASVEISNDSGLTWSTIWSNGTGQLEDADYDSDQGEWYGWNLQTFDISRYADDQQVYIRWVMGPTDGSGVFCGWNIDDVELLESQITYTDPNGEYFLPTDWQKNIMTTKLAGRWVEVINEDTREAIYDEVDIDPNHTANHSWSLADIPSGAYDELNVYYHMNRMIQHILSVDPEYDGMDPDRKGPIKVITRWSENYNNAFWSPEHMICFGEGDSKQNGYRNFALFADIVYHEYTHAVTESFYSYFMPHPGSPLNTTDGEDGPVFTTELDAMHEAFSDYWAATLTDDPRIGAGDIWIGHEYVRTLDNTYVFPDDYGDDPYANSLILSGAMWDTRQELGQEVADGLFHFSRYGGDTTFADYMASVLSHDRRAYHGAHLETLKDIFGFRGISKFPEPPSRLIATADNTVIHLTWEGVDDPDVVGYYVYYRTENDIETSKEDPSVRRDVGNETSYPVEGLSNETTYVLKLTAYNIYGTESEYSDYVYSTPYDPAKDSRYSLGGSGDDDESILGLCFIDTINNLL